MSKIGKEQTRKQNANRHAFLNEIFFPGISGYMSKEVGDWVLVRQFNGNTSRWEVAIYTGVSYKKSRGFLGKQQRLI